MKRFVATLFACLVIAAAGFAVVWTIFRTEPTAERSNAVRRSAMLVDVVEIEVGDFRPTIRALGTVEPARDITLSPRVPGEIVEMSDAFVPGGVVAEDALLFELERDDYRNALARRRSELDQALAALEIELGRQNVAREDLELLDESIPDENRALVLREPQVLAAESVVESARAAVRQAELDLRRTRIRAPFDALVLERAANLGSQVRGGDPLGRLVGVDEYWVVATIPQAALRRLRFPAGDELGPEVRVRNRTAWPADRFRVGRLARSLGALDGETRMARVLVEVADPLSLDDANTGQPPLLLGAFVEAELPAAELTGVARLPRELLRDDDTVWVMEDGVLRIRDVEIAFEDAEYAYLSSGLRGGAKVVTTHLRTIVDGAPLRVAGDDGSGAGDGSGAR